MDIFEKLSCAKFFQKEALQDENYDIRKEAYRMLWYTKEALEDDDWCIRREAKIFLDMIVTE